MNKEVSEQTDKLPDYIATLGQTWGGLLRQNRSVMQLSEEAIDIEETQHFFEPSFLSSFAVASSPLTRRYMSSVGHYVAEEVLKNVLSKPPTREYKVVTPSGTFSASFEESGAGVGETTMAVWRGTDVEGDIVDFAKQLEEKNETIRQYEEFADILAERNRRNMRSVLWTYNSAIVATTAIALLAFMYA